MDTNMLYAGLYSAKGASYYILNAINKGRIRLVLSTTLIFEYEDVLKRNQSVLGLSKQEIDIILDNLCKRGEYQAVYFLWRPQLSDQKDDHVLELAVASETKTIVTHKIKDFRGTNKFGVKAITPGRLLEELR